MIKRLLIYYYFLSFTFILSVSLKCGENEIENCETCGSGESANTCLKCKDKYFLIFHNLYCKSCDDPEYGQVGCGGNCDSLNYLNTGFAFCNDNDCKEGFYNLNGICYDCNNGVPNCKKCKVEQENENSPLKYECEECISNEYKLYENHGCGKCYLTNCEKCHYYEDITVCDECKIGFYLKDGMCIECKEVNIDDGKCKVCSDDLNDFESGPCWCNEYFTQSSHSTCVKCPDNCPYCEYNKDTTETECIKCKSGYTVNSQKSCSQCGEGCEYCTLDSENNPICSTCFSKTFLPQNNQCIICPENCKNCKYGQNDKVECSECNSQYTVAEDGTCKKCPDNCKLCYSNDNKVECSACFYGYALNEENECKECDEGCESCGYNKVSGKKECYQCKTEEGEENKYTFVNNKYECHSNTDSTQEEFYGCLISNYNEHSNQYECIKCKNYFTLIKDEKICIDNQYNNGIYSLYQCLVGKKNDDNTYICEECVSESTKIINHENLVICNNRWNTLELCLEGKEEETDEDENIYYNNICTKCDINSTLIKNICVCNSNSFKYPYEFNKCYRCDDIYYSNPGCNPEEGCTFFNTNGQINCNKCKTGYFEYTKGQCFPCSNEILNCIECHNDDSNNQLICDKCIDGFTYSAADKKCILKDCEDYPEISPGCIICQNNRNEYISNKMCHACKTGYFKTKENKCINCRTEEYGGISCYKCGYEKNESGEELNSIKCQKCPKIGHALSPDGKCYNCKLYFSDKCSVCGFVKDENGNEGNLKCLLCTPGYYLNSDGECIDYSNYLKKIPYCSEYYYQINDIDFLFESYDKYSYNYYCKKNNNGDCYNLNVELSEDSNYYDYIIPIIDFEINTECMGCKYGYSLDLDGNCIKLDDNSCSLLSISQNFPKLFFDCQNYCYNKNYMFVDVRIENTNEKEEENEILLNMYDFFNDKYKDYNYPDKNNIINIFNDLDDNIKLEIIRNQFCVNKDINEENFKNCKRVEFIKEKKNYECSSCIGGYYLDIETKKCIYDSSLSLEGTLFCDFENIGTSLDPIYSCQTCNKKSYALVTTETGAKFCAYKEKGLENCQEAIANTTYANNFYNCTSCSVNYFPYYSVLHGRKICQNIRAETEMKKEINMKSFENSESTPSKNGLCERNDLFTPDGKHCYACNDDKVGMPGCKGSCTFSLERNDILKCEGGCEIGYIESSEGICEPCDSINNGCYECHYEDTYPDNYFGVKRKRRFVWDFCENDFIKSENGKCLQCSDFGLESCDKCEIDPKTNSYKCVKCQEWYYLEDGECDDCDEEGEFIVNNKCLDCDDVEEGGIEGCSDCEYNDNKKLICQNCNSDYILLKNNYTCLKRIENKKLENFGDCEVLLLENNELHCTRCKKKYTLYEGKCIYIPL